LKTLFVSLDVAHRNGGIQRFDQRVVRALEEICGRPPVAIGLRDHADAHCPNAVTRVDGCGGSKSRLVRRFVRHLISADPDTILFGHVMLAPLAAIARVLRPGARKLLFVHGIDVWNDPAYHALSRIERRALRSWIDGIVSVSQFTLDRLHSAVPNLSKPQWVLPNAVDLAESVDRDLIPSTGLPQILTVSRLDEMGKGVGTALRAISRVVKRFGPVRFVVVGDGKMRGECERIAAETGAAAYTHFVGRVSDEELDKHYRQSQVFLLPSTKEGFGIVYLEAWMRGLPVIAGNVDASREVIDDGLNGLIVDPNDSHAVADAVVRVLRDPATGLAMGRAGREKAIGKYAHHRFVARLRNLLVCPEEPALHTGVANLEGAR